MNDVPSNHLNPFASNKLIGALTWLLDDAGDAGEHLDTDGNEHGDVATAKAVLLDYSASEIIQRSALQAVLEGMYARGQTHGDDGVIFDSVENAASELVAAGSSLEWFPAPCPAP